MSVKDVIKKSFLVNFQETDMSIRTIALCLAAAALIGIFIFLVYRLATANSFYSKSFNLSLILMCIITAAIIITIQSSVIVSLGMVGALSIVRFRTAVKEPLDLIFMFWSISVGIICGTGFLGLAVMLSVLVAGILLVFQWVPEQRKSQLLMVSLENNGQVKGVLEIVSAADKHYHVKSRNITENNVDVLLEICLKDCEKLLEDLEQAEGVRSISLIAHRGDAIG